MTARYSRQTVLPEIGPSGQTLLGKARILVVGAGGLGAPALLYLTAAGVGLRQLGGCIGIIDDDHVDHSNLQRQIVFRESDQGKPKASSTAAHLSLLNSETCLIAHTERLTAANALALLTDYDIVIDGSDNFATKYLINDAAVKLGKPVVYGSILGFEGQVSVFSAPHGPCYRCIYPEAAQGHIPNCAEAGTLGGIAGVIGSMQAIEACKLALGAEHCQSHDLVPLIGKLLLFDARNWDIRKLDVSRQPDCPVCSRPTADIRLDQPSSPMCSTQTVTAITLADLNDLYESGVPVTLIDVRSEAEWASGYLNGALHMPLPLLLADDADLSQLDPQSLIIVYCQQGIRSQQAAQHLAQRGFNVLNLKTAF